MHLMKRNKVLLSVKKLSLILSFFVILSCGYFKVDVSSTNEQFSKLSDISLSIQRETLPHPLIINEGSRLTVNLSLNKAAKDSNQFDIIFEGTKGEAASLYFDLSSNTLTIPAGETVASIEIVPLNDATFYNPSQWSFRVVSKNPEILSTDSLEFTLNDNEQASDPNFGKIKSNFGTISLSSETATAIQTLNDGKILVAGYSNASGSNDFTIIKYNSLGALDTSFGSNGKITTDLSAGSNDQPLAMRIQPDGKILVAGTSNPNGNSDIALVRYTPAGNLDSTFGNNGKVFTDIGAGSTDIGQTLQIQGSGKIIIGGYSNVNGANDFILVKYNSTGTLDTTFGVNGKIITDVSGNDFVYDMEVQTDGKIILAGSAYTTNYEFAMIRYTNVGVIDTTFGNNGKVLTDIETNSTDYGSSIKILNDGKILFTGTSNKGSGNDIALVQYTNNGVIDTTFGANGKVTTDIGSNTTDYATSIQVTGTGKILVAGYTSSFNNDFALLQYNSSGLLDSEFGFGGKAIVDLGSSSKDTVYDLKLHANGKILLVGSSDMNGSLDFALLRYLNTGALDTSFGQNAKVLSDIGTGSADLLTSMQVQSDGKILLAGQSNFNLNGNFDFALTRYNSSGTLDTTFGSNGKMMTDLNSNSVDTLTSLEIQTNGKIIAAGYSTFGTDTDISLVRYNPNGTVDSTFGSSSKVLTDINAHSIDKANAIKLQFSSKILVAGSTKTGSNSDFVLVRYTILGALDTTFGTNGVVVTDIGTNSWDEAYSLQLQTDGKILLAGISNTTGNQDITLTRYTFNGVPDTSFGNNGKVITNLGGNDFAYNIQIQDDNKILVAGTSNVNGNNDFLLIRYLPTGVLDSTFGNNGVVQIDISNSSSDSADSLKIRPDGKILMSGYTNINGKFSSAIIQLTPVGVLDQNFGVNGKVLVDNSSNYIIDKNPIQILPDGNVFVGSTSKEFDFTSFDFLLFRLDELGNFN